MSIKAKRISGLVLFIVGLIVALGAYLLSGAHPHDLTQNMYESMAVTAGASLALAGFLTAVSPKRLLVSDREKINHLEKRIAQLERNQKNTP